MPVISQTTQKKKFSSKLILRAFIYDNRVGKTSVSIGNISCQFPQKEQISKTFGFLLTLFLCE